MRWVNTMLPIQNTDQVRLVSWYFRHVNVHDLQQHLQLNHHDVVMADFRNFDNNSYSQQQRGQVDFPERQNRARYIMTQMQYSQIKIAKEVGIHPSTLSEWFNGRKMNTFRVRQAGDVVCELLKNIFTIL